MKIRAALTTCLVLAATLQAGVLRAQQRVRVTVFVLPGGEIDPAVTTEVSLGLVKALRPNARLEVKDPDKLLVEFSGEVPQDAITSAREALTRGLELLKAGRPKEALPPLRQAIEGLEPVLAFIKKKELAGAFLALGVAQAMTGNRRGAYKTFLGVLVWRPQLRYDTAAFNPKYLSLFARAQAAAKRLPRGSVELTTTPPGVNAYVDGRFVGVTPTVGFGLQVGTHYVTYKKPGYVKSAQKVVVSPRVQEMSHQPMQRAEKVLLLEQSLESVRKDLGQPRATGAMVDLRGFLFIDQALFVVPRQVGVHRVHLDAHLYDLRSRVRLSHATSTLNYTKPRGMQKLARLLYHDVRYDGTLAAPAEPPPPPPPRRRPFYATWWFWTAIGVGTAAIVTTAVFWPEGNSCAEDARCITIRN